MKEVEERRKIRKRVTIWKKSEDKTCVICEKKFQGKGLTKTCSLECRSTYRKISKQKSQKKYSEFQKKLHKGERKRSGWINCIVCDKRFTKKGNFVICSAECRKKRKIENDKIRHSKIARCFYCHKRFRKTTELSKFCSSECKKNRNKELLELGGDKFRDKFKDYPWCVVCNKWIDKKGKVRNVSKTCSLECLKIYKKKKRREQHIKEFHQGKNKSLVRTDRIRVEGLKIFFSCAVCNKEFERQGSSSKLTCSLECSKIRKRKKHNEDEKKRRLKKFPPKIAY